MVLKTVLCCKGYGKRVIREAQSQGREWAENLNAFRTQPQYKTGRRALYGGGGLAALATILNMGTEEEQEQLR